MLFYLRKNLLLVFFLGVLSGLPLALTASTLSILLRERGIDLATIAAFALIGIPHILKFLWSPLLDNLMVPYLSIKLGRRRSQLLLVSSLLSISILILSNIAVMGEVTAIATVALSLAFLSASQDIIIDAMRIELLPLKEQAAGSSMATTGYRVAMIISSSGVLSIAHFINWEVAYLSMAALSTLILFGCIIFYQERIEIRKKSNIHFFSYLAHTFVKPLTDIYKRTNFFHMLMFVIFFKMSDALLMALTSPFLLDMGFSKLDIAWVVKSFGMGATIIGALFGGYIANKIGLKKFVVLGLITQMLSNLSYLLLLLDNSMTMLFLVTTIEYSCSGISTTGLVAYISMLCNRQFTASQYALLSALASFARATVAGTTGLMVEHLGWANFFLITAIASMPALLLVKKAFALKRISYDKTNDRCASEVKGL
jgi:PAT family beta-lactamase induction signal transducer AmpG